METSARVNWKLVLIGAALIYAATSIAGFLIGMFYAVSGGHGVSLAVIAASNMAISIIGFTAVGSMAPSQRWKNILLVAIAIMVLSLSNIAFGLASFQQWMMGVVIIFVLAGIAGLLSMLVTALIRAARSGPSSG